jgi:hypothetical protein
MVWLDIRQRYLGDSLIVSHLMLQLTEQAFDISKVRKIKDWHPLVGQKVELSRVYGFLSIANTLNCQL